MNLQKMIDAQKHLLEHICTEKGLQEKDLLADTYVALQVELAEFANEGRWFKYWSEDQEPNEKTLDLFKLIWTNPILEEFADGVHFCLQIAILQGWEDALYIFEDQLDSDEFDGNLSEWYLEMTYFINKSYMEKYEEIDIVAGFQKNEYFFRLAWILFLNIGINGFGFTPEQIEQAYYEKNEINHERQANGY